MIEIILAIITGILTIITTFGGAVVIQKCNSQSECCSDIVLQTSPNEDTE